MVTLLPMTYNKIIKLTVDKGIIEKLYSFESFCLITVIQIRETRKIFPGKHIADIIVLIINSFFHARRNNRNYCSAYLQSFFSNVIRLFNFPKRNCFYRSSVVSLPICDHTSRYECWDLHRTQRVITHDYTDARARMILIIMMLLAQTSIYLLDC